MCEFISWLKHDEKILFLTDKELETEKGCRLREYLDLQFKNDIKGHGAIRHYFFSSSDIREGIEYECSDFKSPDKFPPEIILALKNGLFKNIAGVVPRNILSETIEAEYDQKRNVILAEYDQKRNAIDAEYEQKRKAIKAEYDQKRGAIKAEYDPTKWNTIDAEYDQKRKAIYAEYWDLIKDPKNRSEAWK